MKICFIAGLSSIHVQQWVSWFVKRGHEVHIITPTLPLDNRKFDCFKDNLYIHSFTYDRHPLMRLPFRSQWIFPALCTKIMKEIRPDIVHGHDIMSAGLSTVFAGSYLKVISAWGSDVLIAPKNSFINKLIVKYTVKNVNLILAESEIMKKKIEEFGNSLNIEVIPWGIDINIFNPTFKPDEDIKNLKCNLSLYNSPTVISTRQFCYVYDIETLVMAIPYVVKKVPHAKFILKRPGIRTGTEEFKEKLIKLTRDLGVYESVRFVGETEYKEIPKYLNASDIYVSTSLSDSCSVSMLEAMACGLPVVVSDEPSNFEWIKDGWNGYIFPRKDHEALAGKLIMLLKDKEKRKLFGKRNREIIEERGDWDKNMEKVEQLYKNLSNYSVGTKIYL